MKLETGKWADTDIARMLKYRANITCIDVFSFYLSELDQSNVTEENPEGEEHPPADSENK